MKRKSDNLVEHFSSNSDLASAIISASKFSLFEALQSTEDMKEDSPETHYVSLCVKTQLRCVRCVCTLEHVCECICFVR